MRTLWLLLLLAALGFASTAAAAAASTEADQPAEAAAVVASAAQPAYSSNITECVRHAGSGCVECMLKRTIYDDSRPGPYYAEAASIPATAAAGSAAAAEVALPAIAPSGSTEDVEVARVLAAGARAPSQQPSSTAAAAVREAPAAAVAGSPPGYVLYTKQYSSGSGPHSGQYGGGYDESHTPHEQGPGYERHPHHEYGGHPKPDYGGHDSYTGPAHPKPDYGGHDSYSPPGFHPYQGYDDYPKDGYDSYGSHSHVRHVDEWLCTVCDTEQNYELKPNATQCGCRDGYGVVYTNSAHSKVDLWKLLGTGQRQSLRAFTCEQCAEGQVPFGPGSNLELVWDGSSWVLRLIDDGSSARKGAKKGGNGAKKGGNGAKQGGNGVKNGGSGVKNGANGATKGGGGQQPGDNINTVNRMPGSSGSSRGSDFRRISSKDKLGMLVGAGVQSAEEYTYSSWSQDGGIAPPYYPGECVTCPEGSHVEGNMCWSNDGPKPPPPSPSPTPSPKPPSPSPNPPSPSPTPPSPSPSPSPSPPPSGYCCGGASCSTPVPEPPQDAPQVREDGGQGAAGQRPRTRGGKEDAFIPSTHRLRKRRVRSKQPGAQDICEDNPRVALGAPPFTGVPKNVPYLMIYVADLAEDTTCAFNTTTDFLPPLICTGQQLAPYLVLTSEHCLSGAAVKAQPGCAAAEVIDIIGCYDHNPADSGGIPDFEGCPDESLIYTVGYSANSRDGGSANLPAAARPYDQAIVFMDTPRPGPFFQYNYIENVDTGSTSNSWQAMSYAGRGGTVGEARFCGCEVCPGTTCNLARAGPWTGELQVDAARPTNMAYNAKLEVCVSGNGNCLSMNGDACCVGTYSYEYNPATPCTSSCASYWSGISSGRPLSALWDQVQVELPKF